ncbi:hypothetical protein [Rhabdothermincola sediminis]|uniref:hypothetical protein n=1 Tax=Rhabdothermincola sediminis TaxID=2751370 RepID=UPI001F40BFA2|nr:hypothetical protein [Rhabdothermincola sediminis]
MGGGYDLARVGMFVVASFHFGCLKLTELHFESLECPVELLQRSLVSLAASPPTLDDAPHHQQGAERDEQDRRRLASDQEERRGHEYRHDHRDDGKALPLRWIGRLWCGESPIGKDRIEVRRSVKRDDRAGLMGRGVAMVFYAQHRIADHDAVF